MSDDVNRYANCAVNAPTQSMITSGKPPFSHSVPSIPASINMAAAMNVKVPENVKIHQWILDELHRLYIRKNNDYGDSFHLLFQEEGMAAIRIRLGDKLNRFKTLTKGVDQKVSDESVRDTLIDLANYAIMGIIEMDRVTGYRDPTAPDED